MRWGTATRRDRGMRIAFLPDGVTPNSVYRSIAPMEALTSRGHEVRRLEPANQQRWTEALAWCDVLQVHRVCDEGMVTLARAAKRGGVAIVWDDDDDVTSVPRSDPRYRVAGGLKGSRRLAARQKLFELVDLVTAPSSVLAERFRSAGATHVETIENYVVHDRIRPGARDGSITIGWTAGREHHLDLDRLPIRDTLQRLLEAHPCVRVTSIGISLKLSHERYRHLDRVPFAKLLDVVSTFDVGLAPLSSEWQINHTRSNVKLKEYATAGVPWLASPIGPYAGMGEKQGGRLVADDCWHEELERLVRDDGARRKLAKRAARWSETQTVIRNLDRWEAALGRALERGGARA